MLDKVQHLHQLWQHLGPEWLAYRLSYAARMRTGALRRKMPAAAWEDQPLAGFLTDQALAEPLSYKEYRRNEAPPFFFSVSHRAEYQPLFALWDTERDTPVRISEDIQLGRLRYFESTTVEAGFPPHWHSNPLTGDRTPDSHHWSEIGDFDYGDLKIIWEPSRFSFVYALVRAYWRTGNEQYAEIFWRLVADWREHNSPQLGANWKCGQEISFRVMAWCFGLYGFLDAAGTPAEQVAQLAQMIAVSGVRIHANLDYALSQQSNHGISEGVGLFTIGALFPEFRLAEQWKETGQRVLETLGKELIYDDGAFSQHSANYHRLMLHDYLWALRLGEVLGQPFSVELQERVSKAGEFLYQLQDDNGGQVPNYGQNDGALLLPLSNCGYHDFRPVIQSAHYLAERTRCYSAGPWDEDLLWLFGPEALAAPVAKKVRADFKAEQAGCYTLRSEESFAFARCSMFQHRPSQADLLHLDLWWRGQNIALDAGTFSYNAPPPWDNPLARTAYHNTVGVDGLDQMDRAGRFLWLPWAKGRVRSSNRTANGHLAYWEGAHDGYERLDDPVCHRRAILQVSTHWLVIDQLASTGEHEYRLHWLLLDAPYESDDKDMRLKLETSKGFYFMQVSASSSKSEWSLVRADEASPRGWRAPCYNTREPALSLAVTARANTMKFCTLFGPQPCWLSLSELAIQLHTDKWQATIEFRAENRQSSFVNSVLVDGVVTDQLEIP